MSGLLRLLNPRRRAARWPLKVAIFAAVLLLALFPDPRLLVRNLAHWSRVDELPDPDNPALGPWVEQLEARLGGDETPKQVLARVESFVRRNVPYEWDWVTWGAADYLPTLAEIMALDPIREDCDGRAVVAASILRKLGYDARLVSDTKHVWVWTPRGETMGPGGRKFLVSDRKGTRLDWRALTATPANLAYGVAVFPWARELVVLLVLWLLLLRAGMRWRLAAVGLAVLLDGWLIIRVCCHDPWATGAGPALGAWLGWGHIVLAIAILLAAGKPRRRSLAAGRPL